MENLAQSEAFFFISSIGFVFLWALLAVFLIYLIRATSAFSRVMEKIEEDVGSMGDTTKEALEEMRDSAIFNFIFRKKKRKNKKN